jgi:hypothetical protein
MSVQPDGGVVRRRFRVGVATPRVIPVGMAANMGADVQASLTGAEEPEIRVMELFRPYIAIAALAFVLGMSGYGAGALARAAIAKPLQAVVIEAPLYGGKHI